MASSRANITFYVRSRVTPARIASTVRAGSGVQTPAEEDILSSPPHPVGCGSHPTPTQRTDLAPNQCAVTTNTNTNTAHFPLLHLCTLASPYFWLSAVGLLLTTVLLKLLSRANLVGCRCSSDGPYGCSGPLPILGKL
jgi:hypothetical protein